MSEKRRFSRTITAAELRKLAADPSCDSRMFMRCKMIEAANAIDGLTVDLQLRNADLDELRLVFAEFKNADDTPDLWASLIRQRDEARAEIERLKAELASQTPSPNPEDER